MLIGGFGLGVRQVVTEVFVNVKVYGYFTIAATGKWHMLPVGNLEWSMNGWR